MVLGPTPEFCLRASSAPDLADLTAATILSFRRVLGLGELAPPPEGPSIPLA